MQNHLGSPAEPTRNEDVDVTQPDGGLKPVAGVQNIQFLRASRNKAELDGQPIPTILP